MEIVIEEHLGLVNKSIDKLFTRQFDFAHYGVEKDDLFQTGCLGLMKAAEKFDPSMGTKFSTYAIPYIMGYIRREFREKDKLIKFPRFAYDIGHKLIRSMERDLTPNEIAERFDISIDDAEIVIAYLQSKNNISLDCKMDQENGSYTTYGDMVPDSFNLEMSIEKKEIFNEKMKLLNDRERIIVMHTLNGMKQKDIGDLLGVSQVQVSRIVTKIMDKFGSYTPKKKKSHINGMKKKDLFVKLFNEGKSRQEIVEIIEIENNQFYAYKAKYIQNKYQNKLNNINNTDKTAV